MRLAGAALLALLAGCVVPPGVEPARPPPSNQPPFVLRAWPEPGVIRMPRECLASIEFRLEGISDCDAADTVEVRWFVDETVPFDGSSYRGGPGVTQCVRSPGEDSFAFSRDPQPGRVSVSELGEIAQLEAVLSDGFAPVGPRAAQPGRAITRVGWTLLLSEGPCP